mgnify:CR=1 FL=1
MMKKKKNADVVETEAAEAVTEETKTSKLVATTNLNLKFFNLPQPLYPHAILHSSVSACNLELSQHLLLSQHNCHYNTDDKCKHTYNHKSPWFL